MIVFCVYQTSRKLGFIKYSGWRTRTLIGIRLLEFSGGAKKRTFFKRQMPAVEDLMHSAKNNPSLRTNEGSQRRYTIKVNKRVINLSNILAITIKQSIEKLIYFLSGS